MVKKKSAKKTTHKEKEVKAESKKEEPLIQINKSTVLTAVIFLLVGLIIGALVVSALDINYNNNSKLFQNDANIKEKLTSYLNENFRDPEMLTNEVVFFLEDSENLSSDTIGYEVFVNIDGLVQPAGAIIYINGENFVIASSYPINLNEPFDEIENN